MRQARQIAREDHAGAVRGKGSGDEMIFRVVLLFSLFVFGTAVNGEEYRLPPRNSWKKLYNKAEIIKTEVSREIDEADKSRWIDAYADLHTCTDIPLSSLRETILDYESYPRIFKRYKGMQVIRENGLLYHDMAAGIEVFGIAYTVRFRQLVTVLADEPDRLIIDYSYAWGDGRVRDVRGAWYFESLPGTGWCYVRYFAASRMMQRFPLQRFIMSMLIDGETKDALAQFLAAARNRNAGGK
jgi:ribosome-associated toxin RatA of RatAB toxin-antitoxin module